MALAVSHYNVQRVPNPYPHPGGLPWQVYHTVRNAVFRTCRTFGPTGAMGECPIIANLEQPPIDWPLGDKQCAFFVVDDQYSDERYVYLEANDRSLVTVAWLEAIARTLEHYPGWGVGVCNVPEGYLLIFADKLMVAGRPFDDCSGVGDVAAALQRSLQADEDRIGDIAQ